MKWSAHSVLEPNSVYFIIISYLLFFCVFKYAFVTFLLVDFAPNPGVQIAYNNCMSIYSMHWIHNIFRIHFQSRENGQCHMSVMADPTRKSG
jgi:hypothetical protein